MSYKPEDPVPPEATGKVLPVTGWTKGIEGQVLKVAGNILPTGGKAAGVNGQVLKVTGKVEVFEPPLGIGPP